MQLQAEHRLLVTLEENVASGGFGEKVREFADEHEINMELLQICIPDEYVEHGNVELLEKEIGIDAETIFKRTEEMWQKINQ